MAQQKDKRKEQQVGTDRRHVMERFENVKIFILNVYYVH
jgi:hypothetical protein